MSNNRDLHDDHISRLYQMGEQPEPPEHLDRKIKSAAHAATSVKQKRYLWPSLATAAVLVLSISLVLKVLQQEPMEDAVIGTSATNGDAISPNATLHEEKLAEDAMEQEEATVRRYRATKQKAVPTLAKPQTADTIKLEAAPAISSKLESQQTEPMNCRDVQLPETDAKEKWISLYQQALRLGDAKTATCLQQAYRARFKQAIPTNVEK
jgi:hypothetical protein